MLSHPVTRILAVAAVACGFATAGYSAAAAAQKAHAGKVIRITTRRFVFVPNEITLKKGSQVTLEFRSDDVLMGFNAPDFAQRADLVPGKVTRVTLVPQKTGTYPFLCDV